LGVKLFGLAGDQVFKFEVYPFSFYLSVKQVRKDQICHEDQNPSKLDLSKYSAGQESRRPRQQCCCSNSQKKKQINFGVFFFCQFSEKSRVIFISKGAR
jgi:hypothetical protein